MCFAGSFFLSSLYKLWYLEPRMMFQNVAFNLPSGIMISRSHYRNAICLHDLYFAFSLPDSIGLVLYTQKYAINCFYSRSCSYDSCWHRSDWIPCLFMLDRRYVCISARFWWQNCTGKVLIYHILWNLGYILAYCYMHNKNRWNFSTIHIRSWY